MTKEEWNDLVAERRQTTEVLLKITKYTDIDTTINIMKELWPERDYSYLVAPVAASDFSKQVSLADYIDPRKSK